MLGARKKAVPAGKNGAGTSELKAIDPLRNLGECFCLSFVQHMNNPPRCACDRLVSITDTVISPPPPPTPMSSGTRKYNLKS